MIRHKLPIVNVLALLSLCLFYGGVGKESLYNDDPIFSWEEVEDCINRKIYVDDDHPRLFMGIYSGKILYPIPNQVPCPICGKPSEDLYWIYYSSPKCIWNRLCGRAGPLSICTDCHLQVQFICHFMS